MRLSLAVLAAVLALVAAAPAAAVEPTPTRIAVFGTGSVTLPPDVATINGSVDTNSDNAGEAISRNNAIYDRIVKAVVALGVARDDVTLSYYNVNYNPRPKTSPDPDQHYGYTVGRGFQVKVRQIARTGTIVDACTAAGSTNINGVAFGLADSSAARAQATVKAVADARAKAEALARAEHLRLLSVERIDFGETEPIAPRPMMKTIAAVVPTQFDQSNVSVTVSIGVTYLARP